jgi:nitrite reductase/ring-hydroxylating ferredoxin subunit
MSLHLPMARRTETVARWSELKDRSPAYALVEGVDLVVIRHDDRVSVLYGRCHHRGALLADGHVDGPNLICGLHGWDYRYDTGVSEYENSEVLERFTAWVDLDEDQVLVDADEVAEWAETHPQPYRRDEYLGLYQDVHGTPDEAHNGHIQRLAREGIEGVGHHGPVDAMGVPAEQLPRWTDLQVVTAQLARRPLADDAPVGTHIVIGPRARRPLRLEIPIFVSDMSFGALSAEAKIALSMGAEMAGTGICSGEGGMLPDEREANSRYFYELASGRFGWSVEKAATCQAFHFKGGQGAKTGTGGHLPGAKVTEKIAEVRGLKPGQDAVSPSRFPDLETPADFAEVAEQVREASGGIPVGFKLSAQHIEADLDFAMEAGADYIILEPQDGGRLPEGPGPWGGWRGHCQLRHPGRGLPGHAGLPHEQLPRGDRHPATPSSRSVDRGEIRRTACQLPDGGRVVDAGPGPGLWPRPPVPIESRGSHHLGSGDG